MTFLAQYSQLLLLKLEQSELQFRQQTLSSMDRAREREVSRIEEEYAQLSMGGEERDPNDDPYYQYLARQTQASQVKADCISAELQTVERFIESLQSSMKTGIQASCSTTIQSS